MRLSNVLVGILNLITALIGLALVGAGIYLAVKRDTECSHLLQWPAIGVGAFIFLVSAAGLVGAWGRVRWLLWLYLFVLFILMLAIIAFTVFMIVMTDKSAGQAISNKGVKEYRLGDYTTWLQRKVIDNTHTWNQIKSCLVDAKVCKSMNKTTTTVSTFYEQTLSSIQSGCCKPPTACNFTYVTPTNWIKATNASADTDCNLWNNDAATLCFNCNSCKAGFLYNLQHNWKKLAIFDAAVLALLILIFSLACCAFRNARYHREEHEHARPPPGFYVKA